MNVLERARTSTRMRSQRHSRLVAQMAGAIIKTFVQLCGGFEVSIDVASLRDWMRNLHWRQSSFIPEGAVFALREPRRTLCNWHSKDRARLSIRRIRVDSLISSDRTVLYTLLTISMLHKMQNERLKFDIPRTLTLSHKS